MNSQNNFENQNAAKHNGKQKLLPKDFARLPEYMSSYFKGYTDDGDY